MLERDKSYCWREDWSSQSSGREESLQLGEWGSRKATDLMWGFREPQKHKEVIQAPCVTWYNPLFLGDHQWRCMLHIFLQRQLCFFWMCHLLKLELGHEQKGPGFLRYVMLSLNNTKLTGKNLRFGKYNHGLRQMCCPYCSIFSARRVHVKNYLTSFFISKINSARDI